MEAFSEVRPPQERSSRRPLILSLQAIVVAIVGLMLVVLQLTVGVTETARQLDGIKSDAMYRAKTGLDLLAAIPAGKVENGQNRTDAEAALGSLRSIADIYARNHPGERIEVETGLPSDDQAVASGNDIVTWGDNDLSVRRGFVLDDGIKRISGFFSVRIDLSDDYAVWHRSIRDRIQLAAFIVL